MFKTKKEIIEIFHEEYKKSCAKQDIEALKTKVEDLTKRIQKLETKKLSPKDQKIQDLQHKIELEIQRLSYRNKQGGITTPDSEALIEMKYELLQLTKAK